MTGDLATGKGIEAAVEGAEIIVHCAGSSKGDEEKALNLVRAASGTGVRHLVYISVVGSDRVPVKSGIDRAMFGYFASKFAAERIVADSGLPWTILRATQFHSLLFTVALGDGKPVALGTDQDELGRKVRTTGVICPFGKTGRWPPELDRCLPWNSVMYSYPNKHIKEKHPLRKRFSRRLPMTWEIDPIHSKVSFAIRVMSVTTTRGHFNKLRGHLHIDEQNLASSWVEAEVDAASIDTHNRLRHTHLRSNTFFAVKKYPTISFRSTRVEHTGGNAYKVTGNLTLLGMTKPVTFDVEYSSRSTGLDARASLTARATMNRDDFGLGRGMMVQSAADKMATVEIALVAVRKSVKTPEAKVKVG